MPSLVKKYNGKWIEVPGVSFEAPSSSTSEVKLGSIFIPANTFTQYDIIGIESRVRKTGGNGNMTIRIRVNTSDTVGGVVLATHIAGTFLSTGLSSFLKRRFVVKTADGTGSGTEVINSTASIIQDIGATNQTFSNLAIDWTSNQFIMVTAQLASSSDIATFRHLYVEFPEGEASVI
jgi:hypothetical protein